MLNLEDGGSSSSLAEDNKFIEVLCKQYGSVRDCQCTGEAGNERFPGNLESERMKTRRQLERATELTSVVRRDGN